LSECWNCQNYVYFYSVKLKRKDMIIAFHTTEQLAEFLRNKLPDVPYIIGHTAINDETFETSIMKHNDVAYYVIRNAFRLEWVLTTECCIEFDDEADCEHYCDTNGIRYDGGHAIQVYGDGSIFTTDHVKSKLPRYDYHSLIK